MGNRIVKIMKTTAKVLIPAALVPALINKLIFERAKHQHKKAIENTDYAGCVQNFYKWRHGKIRYITSGEGEPLLLIHGIAAGASLDEWKDVIFELSKNFKVYAFDLLGFGYSDKKHKSYSAYLYITLINDFINDVIGRQTNIAASGVSAPFAVMAHVFEPEFIKKILLVSPKGIGDYSAMPKNKDIWLKWLLHSPIIGTSLYNIFSSKLFMRYFLTNNLLENKQLAKELADKYYYPAHYGNADAKFSMASFLTKFFNVNADHKIADVDIPLHIIWGTGCPEESVKNYASLMKQNKNLTMSQSKNSKFLPQLEAPQDFALTCWKFF